MRILHIISSADPRGGGPIEGIRLQEDYARSHGLPPGEVVTLDTPEEAAAFDFLVRVHGLGRPAQSHGRTPWGRALARYRYSPAFVPWLRANAGRFDAMLVHGLWNYSALAASRVLPGGGTPYFVFTHGMMDPWFRRRHPLKHAVKQLFWWICEGRLLAGAHSVLFTTEEERRLARTSFIGHRYRGTVVGYGTAAPPPAQADDAATLAAAVPGLGAAPFLLYLSRIHEKKGLDLLVTAVARVAAAVPDLRIVIAGPDDSGLTSRLQAQAAAAGIADRLLWPGPMWGAAKWAAYRAADAFILPSHQENFGVVVAEALACAKPVLITDKVNIWREIAEAGAGLVCADDAAGVEAQLRAWSLLCEGARAEMAAAAQALFARRFDVANVVPALLRTMAALIAERRPPA